MEKIKLSELFYSIQGEGRYMGVPSVFMRTFGCNFKCAGFGLPKGEISIEADNVAQKVHLYQTYEELPLVSTGCDSYASWHPSFKHLSPFYSPDEIVEKIMSVLPFNEWREEHLVITGGEPLLKWQNLYPEMLNNPKMQNLKEITFETNGSQKLTPEFASYLHKWKSHHDYDFWREITFSVSAKLSCSGEERHIAIQPEVVCEYEEYGHTYLKFVVDSEEDLVDVKRAEEEYRAAGFKGDVYLMPCGGTEKLYSQNNTKVALLALKYGYRYSDRLQIPLFKNAWGT